MKKLKSTLPNMVIVLTGFTLVAGLLLGVVNSITAPVAEKVAAEKRANALQEVVPGFDNDPIGQAKEIDANTVVYPAYNGDEFIGAAIEIKTKGFSDGLELLIGLDKDKKVLGYQVMKSGETPGLGAKMADWFQEGSKGNVIGKQAGSLVVTKATPANDEEVMAITASTISSKAFVAALNQAAEALDSYLNSENTNESK